MSAAASPPERILHADPDAAPDPLHVEYDAAPLGRVPSRAVSAEEHGAMTRAGGGHRHGGTE
jgi:hypothetical protein